MHEAVCKMSLWYSSVDEAVPKSYAKEGLNMWSVFFISFTEFIGNVPNQFRLFSCSAD